VTRKPRVAIVGAGRLATFLAVALRESGYTITEIVSRNSPRSRRHARKLAAKVDARAVAERTAALDAELLWCCVPDRAIREAASSLATRAKGKVHFAFHSSGALLSRELASLRKNGAAVASVHPLMTFVPGSRPSLAGVPFALEGDTQGGLPYVGDIYFAALAGISGNAGRGGSCGGAHSHGCEAYEPADHPPDSGKLFAAGPGAFLQRPDHSRRRGDGGQALGCAEEASGGTRSLCRAGAGSAGSVAG
jgi:hypothetical protein